MIYVGVADLKAMRKEKVIDWLRLTQLMEAPSP